MPTREEERETIARQEHKSRASALRFEKIRTESEREKEMVAIIRECLAEAARGNLNTHIMRLIQLRSYGNHSGEHNWVNTITAFKRGFLPKVHPDKFSEFVDRGEEYAQFVHVGVCLISNALDVITTEQTKIVNALGKATTGKIPIYTPPPPDGWRPKALASPPPPTGPRKRMLPGWIGAHGHGAVRRSSIRMFP